MEAGEAAQAAGQTQKHPILQVLVVLGDISGPIFLASMAYQRFYKKRKDAEALQKQQDAVDRQRNAEMNLDNAIETLTKQGLQQKIPRVKLFRCLEELLPLLCLDACHRDVRLTLQGRTKLLIFDQIHAMNNEDHQIRNSGGHAEELKYFLLHNPDVAEVFEETKETSLWPPDLTGVTDILAAYPICSDINEIVNRSVNNRVVHSKSSVILPIFQTRTTVPNYSDFNVLARYDMLVLDNPPAIINPEEGRLDLLTYTLRHLGATTQLEPGKYAGGAGIRQVREWVEGVFDKGTEVHNLQRNLQQARLDRDTLTTYEPVSAAKRQGKAAEVQKLTEKLLDALVHVHAYMDSVVVTSVDWGGDSLYWYVSPLDAVWGFYHANKPLFREFKKQWSEAMLKLGLLAGRFNALPAEERRKAKIAKLFEAIGANDAQRKDFEAWLNSLYEIIRDLWWKQQKNAFKPPPPMQITSPMQFTEQTALMSVKTQKKAVLDLFTENLQNMQEIDDLNSRAQNHTLTGKFDAALADYEKAKDLWPDNAAVLRALGHYYSRLGRFDEAITEFQTAEALVAKDSAPEDAPSLLNLAIIYAKQKENSEEAVKLTRRALALFKAFPMTTTLHNLVCTRQILGWLYHQQGKVDKAIEELGAAGTAMVTNPGAKLDTPHFYLVLGDAYKAAERDPEARESWNRGWQLANQPEWTTKMQGATPFEADEDKAHRTELGKRLGIQENDE